MECQLFLAAYARYFNNYDFSEIEKEPNTRYIAIQSDKPSIDHPFFDDCYICPATRQPREPNATFDYNQLLPLVSEINQTTKISHLICIDEGNILQAAKLRQFLNIEGHKVDDVAFFIQEQTLFPPTWKYSTKSPLNLKLVFLRNEITIVCSAIILKRYLRRRATY